MVPRPAAQIAHAVDADTDFGMIAEVDQVVLGPDLATAPACAVAGLASLGLSLSTHGGSRLPPASVAGASHSSFVQPWRGIPSPRGPSALPRTRAGWCRTGWPVGSKEGPHPCVRVVVQLFACVGLIWGEHGSVKRDGQDQPLQLLGGKLRVVDCQLAVLVCSPQQCGQLRHEPRWPSSPPDLPELRESARFSGY